MGKFTSTIQTYNEHAAQFASHFEQKLDTNELDKFLSLIPKNGYLLDAGCGTARDAAYFVDQGYHALGIDLSEGLLTQAAQLHPEVAIQQMSLTEITLSDELFDGIWCKAALLHLDRTDIPQVLESFFRILKPGGHVFIQTKAGQGEGTQPVPFDASMTRYFTFFSLIEMKELVTKAGLEVLESYSFNGKQRSEQSRDQNWIVIIARKNA